MENVDLKIYAFGITHSEEADDNEDELADGGYAVIITLGGEKIKTLTGKATRTTKPRLDLIAIIEGLKNATVYSNITVCVKNGYILDSINKGWLKKWKKEGFAKRKHAELWMELDNIISQPNLSVNFVPPNTPELKSEFSAAKKLGKMAAGKGKSIDDNSQKKHLGKERVDKDQFDSDAIVWDSISVDVGCINNPGPMDYRGVHTKTRKVIFERKYNYGTNNIGEFLAIVHALALIKKDGLPFKILYSDSYNALTWVKLKKCKTNLERNNANAQLFEHIDRAVKWLENNEYETKILKWKTDVWGQVPADYGRK